MSEDAKQKRRTIGRRTEELAKVEIDARLAQAIRDRAQAMKQVSKLVHWQDRLARLEQEINSLIGFQQRLSGRAVDRVEMLPVPAPVFLAPANFGGHLTPIPDGVTSIPARQPKPTTPNQADTIAGEGGFS